MKPIKKCFGKILYGLGKGIAVVIDAIIGLIENMIVYLGNFLKGCLALASMGGCLFFLLFANLGLRILANPIGLFTVLFLLGFTLYGGRLVASLRYLKYILTEYLFNTANVFILEGNVQYKPLNYFREAYRRAEEERIKEEQRRYYEQQRQWEERIKQQWYQQFYQYQQSQQQYQQSYGQGGGYGQGAYGYGNATMDFKNQYERSCDLLGVSYDADFAQIKSAYRAMAKKYHPDLSSLPDATKRFQEINAAYEFLNEENIARYRRLKHGA